MGHLTKKPGIKRYIGSSLHAQSQGVAESKVKAVSSAIRKIVNSRGGEWYQYIPSVQLALNTTPSQATGYPPFFIQQGRMAREPASLALLNENMRGVPYKEYLIKLAGKVKVWRNVTRKNLRGINNGCKINTIES